MWLEFVSPNGGHKWYAETDDGEYAWSDAQGLYQWFHDKNGELQRIAYTGGDRQYSDRDGIWTTSGHGLPNYRGFVYAMWSYKYGVN